MLQEAAAVIIGSGALGSSVAYHLAKAGIAPVALIDKHEIASQTSPRAAGLTSQVRHSELMTRLASMAIDKIKSFTAETGDNRRAVVALSTQDGQELWRHEETFEPHHIHNFNSLASSLK